jgi:hypothetical protein
MRALWRNLALQWLGGDASEALTGDSTVLESLPVRDTGPTTPVFDVKREPRGVAPGNVDTERCGSNQPRIFRGRGFARDASERLSLLTQPREPGGRRS